MNRFRHGLMVCDAVSEMVQGLHRNSHPLPAFPELQDPAERLSFAALFSYAGLLPSVPLFTLLAAPPEIILHEIAEGF